jgi:hypothetical protein
MLNSHNLGKLHSKGLIAWQEASYLTHGNSEKLIYSIAVRTGKVKGQHLTQLAAPKSS